VRRRVRRRVRRSRRTHEAEARRGEGALEADNLPSNELSQIRMGVNLGKFARPVVNLEDLSLSRSQALSLSLSRSHP